MQTHVPNRSSVIVFVIASVLMAITFVFYNIIVFFQPNKVVEGTVGLLTAMGGIAFAVFRVLPANIPEGFGRAVVLIHEHHRIAFAAVLILWLAAVAWSIVMRDDVFGRYLYVHSLQKSMGQGEYDRASLPDSELLAKAFMAFPNRREVPFLLARSSRLLFQANRRDLFRNFQKNFLKHLNLVAVLKSLCEKKEATSHADGLLFLTMTAGEAYPFEAAQNGQAALKAAADKLEIFVEPLSKCRSSFEADVQRIRLQDTINELAGQKRYDIVAEISKLDQALETAPDEKKVLRFWQSHGAQEYLDFKSYRILSDPKNRASGRIEEAISYYETLLLLRQGSIRPGEIIWNVTPFKLNLFPAFMLASQLKSLAYKHHIELFEGAPEIASVIKHMTERKAFEEFRSPRGWYAGTPLDVAINGSAVTEKINTWLKEDW